MLSLLLHEFGGTAELVLLALEVIEEAGNEEIDQEHWECNDLNFKPEVNSWWRDITILVGEKLPVTLVHEPISEENDIAHGNSSIEDVLDFCVQGLLGLRVIISRDDNINTSQLEHMGQDHGADGDLLVII